MDSIAQLRKNYTIGQLSETEVPASAALTLTLATDVHGFGPQAHVPHGHINHRNRLRHALQKPMILAKAPLLL